MGRVFDGRDLDAEREHVEEDVEQNQTAVRPVRVRRRPGLLGPRTESGCHEQGEDGFHR